MIEVMKSSKDSTITNSDDPTDDKLLFLNGRERLKYFHGKRDFQRKKNKAGSVIQYLRNLIKF